MKFRSLLLAFCLSLYLSSSAQVVTVNSPDSLLSVVIQCDTAGKPYYRVDYNGSCLVDLLPL